MKVYIFGNEDLPEDSLAFQVARRLNPLENIEFIPVKPNEDLPFVGEKRVVMMDVVGGIDQVMVIDDEQLSKLVTSPRTTVHDFDLGFQLRYLKKLGKLRQVTIIGLPLLGELDYDLIQSILRKLVAQDIQGS